MTVAQAIARELGAEPLTEHTLARALRRLTRPGAPLCLMERRPLSMARELIASQRFREQVRWARAN